MHLKKNICILIFLILYRSISISYPNFLSSKSNGWWEIQIIDFFIQLKICYISCKYTLKKTFVSYATVTGSNKTAAQSYATVTKSKAGAIADDVSNLDAKLF